MLYFWRVPFSIFMHRVLKAVLIFARKCLAGHVIVKRIEKIILKSCASFDIAPRVDERITRRLTVLVTIELFNYVLQHVKAAKCPESVF